MPDTINIIGTRTSPSSSLLSGLNPRSIFYPLFAFLGLKYIADSLMRGTVHSRNASGFIFVVTAAYVIATSVVLWSLGEGYIASRFMFVIPFMLTYTFGIFAAAHTSGGACCRRLYQIMLWAGSCLAAILILEGFILHESIYELLIGHNPTLRDGGYDPRSFGSLSVYRASGPFMSPLRAGFAMLLPFALMLSGIGLYSAKRSFLRVFLLCFMGAGVLATGSLGAIIPALVMVAAYCLLYLLYVEGKWSSKMLVSVMVGLACVIMFSSPFTSLMKDIIALLSGGKATSTVASHAVRYEYFLMGVEYWSGLPLLIQLVGRGVGWMHYDKMGYLAVVEANDFGLYLTMLLEIGVIGMVGVTLFFVVWLASAITGAGRTPVLEAKLFYFSFAAYVIGLFLSFMSFTYYNMFYVVAIGYSIYNLNIPRSRPRKAMSIRERSSCHLVSA